jgi:hypothetical protein
MQDLEFFMAIPLSGEALSILLDAER